MLKKIFSHSLSDIFKKRLILSKTSLEFTFLIKQGQDSSAKYGDVYFLPSSPIIFKNKTLKPLDNNSTPRLEPKQIIRFDLEAV